MVTFEWLTAFSSLLHFAQQQNLRGENQINLQHINYCLCDFYYLLLLCLLDWCPALNSNAINILHFGFLCCAVQCTRWEFLNWATPINCVQHNNNGKPTQHSIALYGTSTSLVILAEPNHLASKQIEQRVYTRSLARENSEIFHRTHTYNSFHSLRMPKMKTKTNAIIMSHSNSVS